MSNQLFFVQMKLFINHMCFTNPAILDEYRWGWKHGQQAASCEPTLQLFMWLQMSGTVGGTD
jgi:hypothetical protein